MSYNDRDMQRDSLYRLTLPQSDKILFVYFSNDAFVVDPMLYIISSKSSLCGSLLPWMLSPLLASMDQRVTCVPVRSR